MPLQHSHDSAQNILCLGSTCIEPAVPYVLQHVFIEKAFVKNVTVMSPPSNGTKEVNYHANRGNSSLELQTVDLVNLIERAICNDVPSGSKTVPAAGTGIYIVIVSFYIFGERRNRYCRISYND